MSRPRLASLPFSGSKMNGRPIISSEAMTSTATPLLPSISPWPSRCRRRSNRKYSLCRPSERAPDQLAPLAACSAVKKISAKSAREIPARAIAWHAASSTACPCQLFLRLPDSSSNHDKPTIRTSAPGVKRESSPDDLKIFVLGTTIQ